MNEWKSFLDFVPGEYAHVYTTQTWESVCKKYALNHDAPNSFVHPPPPLSLAGPAEEQLKELGRFIILRREQWLLKNLHGVVPRDILEKCGASYTEQAELYKIMTEKGYFVRYWKDGKMQLMNGANVISTLPKISFHSTEVE